MKAFLVIAGLVAVTGCQSFQSLPTLPLTAAAQCSEALLATASSDPLVLAIAAATNPACQTLAGDLLETVIEDAREIATKRQRRGNHNG